MKRCFKLPNAMCPSSITQDTTKSSFMFFLSLNRIIGKLLIMGNLTLPETSTYHRDRRVLRGSCRGAQAGVDMCMLCVRGRCNYLCYLLRKDSKGYLGLVNISFIRTSALSKQCHWDSF